MQAKAVYTVLRPECIYIAINLVESKGGKKNLTINTHSSASHAFSAPQSATAAAQSYYLAPE